jgi:hypothetical protein
VPAVVGTATSSDWSSGGALLTFYFPVVLFVVIAAMLYLQLSRPHRVPGHRSLAASTARPGTTESAAKTDTAGPGDEATNVVSPPADNAE